MVALDIRELQKQIQDRLGVDFTIKTRGLTGQRIVVTHDQNRVEIVIDTQIYYLEIHARMRNLLVDLDVDIKILRNQSGDELLLTRLMNCQSDVLDFDHLHDLVDFYFENLPEQTYKDLNSLSEQFCEFVRGFIKSQ